MSRTATSRRLPLRAVLAAMSVTAPTQPLRLGSRATPVARAAVRPGEATPAPKVPPVQISAAFPYETQFVEVLGSQMAYIDEGAGDPFLLLHGNPTSKYLWRNVVPWLKPYGRVIALDLIGMGESAKPDIAYAYADHIRYVEGFVEALGLTNITLVIHDWGSALGFDYASRHEANVKGIAFMEAMVAPTRSASSATMSPAEADFFRPLRDPERGPELVIERNVFIEQVLPANVVRELAEEELDAYRAPYLVPASRRPLLVFPNEVPIDGKPADVVATVDRYNAWLMQTDLPKLHVYVSPPGVLTPPEAVDYLAQRLSNYEAVYVGQGLHFMQEDHPEAIGRAIADWYRRSASGGRSR